MAKKTEIELAEDLSKAIADARARYASIVKPAQEKFKDVERQARITLEENTKPLYDNYPKEVYNPKSYIDAGDYVEGKAFPRTPDNYSEIEQCQKAITAFEELYDFTVAIAEQAYKRIEKPAKQQLDVDERLARQQYYESIKELRKVDEWFEFRRTYQRSLRVTKVPEPCTTHEVPRKQIDVSRKQSDTKDKLKCDFCGDSEARTKAGLNRVMVRMKHPNAGFWNRLLGRDMVYACHDCINYMISLWGPIEVVTIDKNVCTDETYYCKIGHHNMCGGFECKCECHKHISVPDLYTSSVCPSCNGSGRRPWVLPYLTKSWG
ncbi:MAG: hypothetical protein V1854_00275 [Methanobacteriota archaeon]